MRLQREYIEPFYVREYVILMIVIFISSFKSAMSSGEYGDLFVLGLPPYISLPQWYANYITVILMTVSIVLQKNSTRMLEKKSALFAFGIFQLIISIVTQEQGWVIKSISVLIVLLYFVLVISNCCFYKNNYRLDNVVNSIYYGGFLFCLYNLVVYILVPDLVTWKGRLFGVTMHPNFLGTAAALSFIIAFYKLGYTNSESFLFRIVNYLAVIISIIMVFYSDSRTSLGLCFFAVVYFINLKIRDYTLKTILFFGLAIVTLLFYHINMQGSISTNGLGERGFNREATWLELWENVLNPTLFGLGKVGATANSYLFAIVATGIFGGIFFYYTIAHLLIQIRKSDNRAQIIYNVLTFGLLFAAILEGFLLDAISIPVFIFWILVGFGTMRNNLTKKIWKRKSHI